MPHEEVAGRWRRVYRPDWTFGRVFKHRLKSMIGLNPAPKEARIFLQDLIEEIFRVFGPGTKPPRLKFTAFRYVPSARAEVIFLPTPSIEYFWQRRHVIAGDIHEYPEFNDDPIIGEKERVTGEEALRIVMAHEAAHSFWFRMTLYKHKRTIAFWCDYFGIPPNHPVFKDRNSHGILWQNIYAVLRTYLLERYRKTRRRRQIEK